MLDQEVCLQHLQSAYADKTRSRAITFRWYVEFYSGRSSILDEKQTVTENTSAI